MYYLGSDGLRDGDNGLLLLEVLLKLGEALVVLLSRDHLDLHALGLLLFEFDLLCKKLDGELIDDLSVEVHVVGVVPLVLNLVNCLGSASGGLGLGLSLGLRSGGCGGLRSNAVDWLCNHNWLGGGRLGSGGLDDVVRCLDWCGGLWPDNSSAFSSIAGALSIGAVAVTLRAVAVTLGASALSCIDGVLASSM